MEQDTQIKRSFIKNFWVKRRWWIISVVAVAVVTTGLIIKPKNNNDYLTTPVKRQDLKQIVEAAGTVESTKGLDLSFVLNGLVALLKTEVGQTVKTGDLLASLAAQKQEAQVAVAAAAAQAAQADLLKVQSGASAQDLAVAEQKVTQAQASWRSAQSSLTVLQQQADTDLSNWRNILQQSLAANLFVATRAANETHNVLTNDQAAPYFRLIGNSDYSNALINDAANNSQLIILNNNLKQLDVNDAQALIALTNQALSDLLAVQSLLDDTLSLLQRLYAVPPQFTQTNIDTLKTTIATQQGYVATAVTAVQTAKANLVNGQASYNTKINQAQSSVTDAQAALVLAQAQQQQTAAPARSFEIEQVKARLSQAQADLQHARAMLEDYYLRAPIEGVITRVDIRVGEQVQAGQKVISLLGNVPLQVKVKVAEADIPKISVNQDVTITLDAFGDSHPFSGQVAAVDLAPTLVDNVVYYYVTVIFTGDITGVKLGMSANVDILTAQRQNILVIPSRAIKSHGDSLYVQVVKADKSLEERTVTIGLKGQDGLAEVLSGLQEGENVVTLNRTATP